MSNFQSYKTITERLNSLSIKLANEKLSAKELVEFETLARQLYERALILNYKAKEAKVHGEEEMPNEPTQEESTKSNNDSSTEHEKASVTPEQDNSEIDSGEIQFDFTDDEKAVDDEKSEPQESSQEKQTEVREVVEDTGIDKAEKKITEGKNEDANPEPSSKDSISDVFENEKEQSFYERFQQVHNESIGDRLGASKVHTLKGAIGLNDKLQFIAELFEGDSDKFNKTLDALDQQPSNKDARKVLSQVAAKQSWDEENPLVEEFARLIERRYVEE